MRLCNVWLRRWVWSLLVAVMALASGCQTHKALFTVAGPGWRVREGQALWRPRKGYPELAGDLVVASHPDGSCAIDFAKTPLSLVSAQITRAHWLIRFPAGQMEFSGRRHPSTRFLFLYLHAALTGEALPGPLRFARKPDGGWRLENTRSGETLEGFLSP